MFERPRGSRRFTDDTRRTVLGHARRRRLHRPAITAAIMILFGVAACVPDTPADVTGADPSDAPRAGDPAYTEPGPYAVGVTTLKIGNRLAEVWYPADPVDAASTPFDVYHLRDFIPEWLDSFIPEEVDPPFVTRAHRDVPAASDDGPYPLVLFSHGFSSFRLQSSTLTTHLASWGFVVVSPDYLERGLQFVLFDGPGYQLPDTTVASRAVDATRAASDSSGGVLSGLVRPGDIYPIGHSAGGLTSLSMLDRPDVPSAILMSSGWPSIPQVAADTAPRSDKAVMYITGLHDQIVPVDWSRMMYDYSAGEKKLVEVDGTGHINGFTELCEIGDGGIVGVARSASFPAPDFLLTLGADGCSSPPYAPSSVVAPQIAHFMTAELRFRSGLDPEPVGLGDQVLASLPMIASYVHAP